MVKVLLADDDPDTLDITAYALRREGFIVQVASDGREALRVWESGSPDIILLDVRMPKLNGFELLRTIRQQSSVPIIMVTARGDDDDVVRGLQLGADDYVTKPFSPRQLIARIRTVLRRQSDRRADSPAIIQVGDLVLDVESHEVRRGEQSVRLTPLEFRIFYPLMLNVGRVVSSTRLVEQAWGFEGGDTNMLKTHISHIRKKLGLQRGQPGYIEGIPGVGYVLRALRRAWSAGRTTGTQRYGIATSTQRYRDRWAVTWAAPVRAVHKGERLPQRVRVTCPPGSRERHIRRCLLICPRLAGSSARAGSRTYGGCSSWRC